MKIDKFNKHTYEHINYDNWILGDDARKGVNIKNLRILTREEELIFDESFPYQDARNDPGQAEIVALFALKLLKYLPGRREIVVPSAILHDVGWCGNNPDEWRRLVEKNKKNVQVLETELLRRPHQNRGILIAGRILERVGYFDNHPLSQGLEIADIIGDHDTRKLPTTESGKIVRMADLLWRCTYPHAQIYMKGENKETLESRMREVVLIPELLRHLGKIVKQIVEIEIKNTLDYKF